MRVFRVQAFEHMIGFSAITADISRMENEAPPDEVEFTSVPIEMEIDLEIERVICEGDSAVGKPAKSTMSLETVEPGKMVEREEVSEAMEVGVKDLNDDEVDGIETNAIDRKIDDYIYLEDFGIQNLSFTRLDGLSKDADFLAKTNVIEGTAVHEGVVSHGDGVSSCTDVIPVVSEASSSKGVGPGSLGKGFQAAPDEALVKVGQGDERQKSHKNDRWASRRADQLRASLGWDMTIELGDLDFKDLDMLFSDLFTRVVKVNGKEYPSESLMNMRGGFNRIIRRASEVRCVKGNAKTHDPLGQEFNIKHHFAFPRTRLVLRAAMKKSAKNGNNKKRVKVGTVTLEMEMALMLDLEHQITNNQGCQKRLALYLMLRLGIRGGIELWNLTRTDIKLLTDPNGWEFEERESKNNSYDLDRTKEEQFRQTYYTFEEDFILTWKQYIKHMPAMAEGVKADLFMQPICKPAGLVWYNRVTKVAERVCGHWLKNMMILIGLPPELITSNKAGRVTLITRMVACGVPNEVRMLVTRHHMTDEYGRYDRTKELKMEVAILAGCTLGLTYDRVLADISKKFIKESIVGSSKGLHPLLNKPQLRRRVS